MEKLGNSLQAGNKRYLVLGSTICPEEENTLDGLQAYIVWAPTENIAFEIALESEPRRLEYLYVTVLPFEDQAELLLQGFLYGFTFNCMHTPNITAIVNKLTGDSDDYRQLY